MKKICLLFLITAFFAACSSTDTNLSPQNPIRGTPGQKSRKHNAQPPEKKASGMIPATGKGPCYQIGYQWGVCTAKNTADGSCDPQKDVQIPKKCNSRPETQQGIKDGLRDTQLRLRRSF